MAAIITPMDGLNEFHGHLLRVALWGAASALAGLAVAWRCGRPLPPGARHLALQLGAWGAINLLLAAAGWRGSPPAAWFLWLNVGLDVGYSGVGLALLLCGRRFGSAALRGAGWGVLPQGIALALLDLWYLARLG